jgi:hypothetical protein
VLERASVRVLPVVNRASEYAPIAPACCNACRVCATSGAVGLVFAGAGAVAAMLLRVGRRIASPFYG